MTAPVVHLHHRNLVAFFVVAVRNRQPLPGEELDCLSSERHRDPEADEDDEQHVDDTLREPAEGSAMEDEDLVGRFEHVLGEDENLHAVHVEDRAEGQQPQNDEDGTLPPQRKQVVEHGFPPFRRAQGRIKHSINRRQNCQQPPQGRFFGSILLF